MTDLVATSHGIIKYGAHEKLGCILFKHNLRHMASRAIILGGTRLAWNL